ncbi:unnamed protein product [Closterium sp. NIES-65]|nr:unnamed protein product [Closterium sp. NIES-65]
MAVAAASASDAQPLTADATAADGPAEGAHSPGARERSNAEGEVKDVRGENGARAENMQAGIVRRREKGGGKITSERKGKSPRRGRMTGKRTESVPGSAGGEARASTLGSAEALTLHEEEIGRNRSDPEDVSISELLREGRQKRKGTEMSALEATQHLAKCQASRESLERGEKKSLAQFSQSSGSALGSSGDLLSLIASQQLMMQQTLQKQQGVASAAAFPARSPAPGISYSSSHLQSSTPSYRLQSFIPAAGAESSAAASGTLQGMCGLSGEHALRSALVSAIASNTQPTCAITIAHLLLQAFALASRGLRSYAPPRPFRRIPHFPLSPFRSASARRALTRYFRPADRSCIESSPMAARSSSRLLALAGRAVSARLAPVAPASAVLAGDVARGFATAAPAEEDVVKAAFIKQQASFRSYLEGLKKVSIPMDAADDKATKAYAAAVKNIRESLGIPSFSEKLSNLLESAEEDSRDVRSFLEESRIIRRQLGVEDKLGAEKLMFAALDSVEKKLGKALVGDDVKGMAMFQEEVNAINKKLGLKDGDLEPLEQQLETSMAKTDIAAFASEATQKIGTYQKRDGLEDIQVNNYGRINSPGDDIRVAMAKNASKAASPTAASGASCDGDDGDEANGDDAEEDWPENGHDDSASGDDVGPADIEEDDWWNRPVGSDDEVEEWHAGDSDNDGGGDDDPWSFGTDDDVPLLKRRLRHRLQSKSKRARVVLSDDDGPEEERRPILTAAEKGKAKVAEAPAKAPAKAPARRRTSNKKLTSGGDPGSSKGAAKKKAKKALNPDDIVVNEPLGSDDEYAAAAGPIPTFPEKRQLQQREQKEEEKRGGREGGGPTHGLPGRQSRRQRGRRLPPPSRSRPPKEPRRVTGKGGGAVHVPPVCRGWRQGMAEAGSGPQEGGAAGGIGAWGGYRTGGDGPGRAATGRYGRRGGRSGRRRVVRAARDAAKSGDGLDNGWMDETAVQTWLSKEVLPHLNPQRGQNARRAMLVLDSYRDHITQTMLQSYRTHSITPAVIPAGWNLQRPPHPVVLQWIADAWDQVPKQIIIDAFRHCGISSKLDGTENHLVMSHLRARSTTDVSADMSLGGTTGDNTRLLGRALEEEEEEAMQAEGVREVAVATGLEVLYQETPNYRGAAAKADRMIKPRETARHAWRVPDLGVEPDVSAGEEAVTEGG